MQSFSRYQSVNLNHPVETLSNDIIDIRQALISSDLNTILGFVLQLNSTSQYDDNGVQRNITFVVIADESTTAFLMIIDLKPDSIKLQHVYQLTKIRKKVINGSTILSTTIDTNIELSTVVCESYFLFECNCLFVNNLDY
jgi:hypothetical protein